MNRHDRSLIDVDRSEKTKALETTGKHSEMGYPMPLDMTMVLNT